MKKIFYTLWVFASVAALTMCSKSPSVQEELELTETFLENEKAVIDPAKMETELLNLVNDHRKSIGESSLQSSPSSYVHAKDHNDYMISKNKLSHDNFEERASKIATEINAVKVSENVARFYNTAEKTLEGWLKSSTHKTTLEGNFTHTTLSVQVDKQGRPYYTQIFMRVDAE
ncbi:CAP domain-containing protein [Flagellimonas myxillae]|uniref:CAP domain-containing protein n=1 Tax=Flagellimonas myxillae TaxID=2942214 RepID=UPI00201EBE21|nr:CAP domain-containing protein [Muricauda myxillae]MCL6267393.1 CAP domain-containing protein [Muricauda myxillae]